MNPSLSSIKFGGLMAFTDGAHSATEDTLRADFFEVEIPGSELQINRSSARATATTLSPAISCYMVS